MDIAAILGSVWRGHGAAGHTRRVAQPGDGRALLEEPVVVYSYVDQDVFATQANVLATLAKDIGRQSNHAQMAFEYDGVMHFEDIGMLFAAPRFTAWGVVFALKFVALTRLVLCAAKVHNWCLYDSDWRRK